MSLVVLLKLIIRHPMHSTFMILCIPRLGHHQIVYSLLRPGSCWRIITHMIGLISRKFFHFNICSIQVTIRTQFASFENVSCRTIWNSIFHETVIFLDVYGWLIISSHINILYWILLQEAGKGAKRIYT